MFSFILDFRRIIIHLKREEINPSSSSSSFSVELFSFSIAFVSFSRQHRRRQRFEAADAEEPSIQCHSILKRTKRDRGEKEWRFAHVCVEDRKSTEFVRTRDEMEEEGSESRGSRERALDHVRPALDCQRHGDRMLSL